MSIKALEYHLAPLMPFLQTEGVTEICINQPGEIYVEQYGQFARHPVESLTIDFLEGLAGLIAEFNHKAFPVTLLSGSLPQGERVQFVLNPACEKNKIVCSIRKHHLKKMQLQDYAAKGAFQEVKIKHKHPAGSDLKSLYQQNDIENFIKTAILARKNILISGGTGTGKTTFLNACLKCVPETERLITVEDVREVRVDQPNVAHLLFTEEHPEASALNVFKACLRLRPDRIFLSELRGSEVWPYLRAANSGHPGSLSTIHADSPESAFAQLVFMMQQAGSTSNDKELRAYLQSVIPIVIQLKRDSHAERFMYVSEIYFDEVYKNF